MLIKRSSYTEIYPPLPHSKKKKIEGHRQSSQYIYIYIDHLFFEFPGYTKAYLWVRSVNTVDSLDFFFTTGLSALITISNAQMHKWFKRPHGGAQMRRKTINILRSNGNLQHTQMLMISCDFFLWIFFAVMFISAFSFP